jgi:mannitol/fructose-specific phosphotransferase system IIA component (Ntr-type)
MKLSQLLSSRHILPDLQAEDRLDAIDELLGHLIEVGDLDSQWKEEICASLHLREAMISTGVGAGVAIPHAFSDHIDEVIGVFGRSHKGVDFDSHDQEKVHFVVLFISPKKSYQKHLLALAAIARLLTKTDTRQKLLLANDADELYSLFRQKTLVLKD